MSEIVSKQSKSNRGKAIEEHLNHVHGDSWFFIYTKYVQSG